jgi:phosphate transport system protein
MATIAVTRENFNEASLVNYLISMARTVEGTVNRAIEALLRRNEALASEVFLLEPHVNEMEILIDERAVRLLRARDLHDETIRFVVASIKINNDLERMGDMAVNIAQRVISLAQMPKTEPPSELLPMSAAVRAMVSKSLGALIYRNVELAKEVLESDDVVDRYRDVIFERLLAGMTADPGLAAPNLQFVLTARYLERIADHTTNISEDVLFWLRGLEVRHGRGLQAATEGREQPRVDPSLGHDSEAGVPDMP